MSIFGTESNSVSADPGALRINGITYPHSPLPLSTHVQNSLITGSGAYAIYLVDQSSFSVANNNLFNNRRDISPASSPNYTNITKIDPGLGSCKVFIPDGSPMKGKGTNGEDIGANIFCRYENGVLMTRSCGTGTGQFPCGAIVSGINNIPGQSCFDVNVRLNVNANGCTLPATPSCKQPAPPAGLPPPGSGGDSSGCPPPFVSDTYIQCIPPDP